MVAKQREAGGKSSKHFIELLSSEMAEPEKASVTSP